MRLSHLVALVALVVVGMAATRTHADVPVPGFAVMTSLNETMPLQGNVVTNGETQPLWSSATGVSAQFQTWTQPSFFMLIDSSQPGVTEFSQFVTISYTVVNPTPNTKVGWTRPSETATVGAAGKGGFAIVMNSTILCDGPDMWYTFGVTITPTAGFTPMTLTFSKQCLKPILEVGTEYQGSDVIHLSKPVSTFAPYIYTADVTSVFFEVWLSPQQTSPDLTTQAVILVVESSDPTEMVAAPTGPLGYEALATQTWDGGVNISFTCTGKTKGILDIPVRGWLDYGYVTVIPFTFIYRCGVGSPLVGFNVGSRFDAANIAVDGRVIGPWATTYHYSPDQTYELDLYMVSNDLATVPYNVTYLTETDGVFVFLPTTPTSGQVKNIIGGDPIPSFVFSTIQCITSGTERGLIQIDVGGYNPIQLKLEYTCAQPVFNVGNEPFSSNMIHLGVTGPVFNVDGAHTDISLYIALDSSSPVASNQWQITLAYAPDVLSPVVSPLTGNATVPNLAQQDSASILAFGCLPCVEFTGSVVTLSIDWGWVVPGQILFTKDCVLTADQKAACADNNKHGGWSAAGIFFFVVFLLITAFCVSGCLFNRFRAHKEGLAIVPGATTVAGWIDRCRTGGRSAAWSPQDDDIQGGGGSSYQSTYSGNL